MYDKFDPQSILSYAQRLLGISLSVANPAAKRYSSGKGGLGQSVEKYHFDYQPNSDAEPDFAEAGVELKCTPLKLLQDGSMVSKERLVLNIIDYIKEAEASFYTSSFWHKNKLILLMFYLHEQGVNVVDLIFKIIRLWSFPEVDLKIIRDDWEKLHWKMTHGLAHEISEGDTFYLGACPKGSKSGAEMRRQLKEGAPKAQQRAYCIKSKYLNTVIYESLLHPEMHNNLYLSKSQLDKIRKSLEEASNIVTSVDEYRDKETFEQLIERKFSPYYGKTIYEIERMLGVTFTDKVKALSNAVIHGILGVTTPKIREFEKANIQQKSIRLEHNGVLKEAMVFSQIQYNDIINEAIWEDSVWYETLTQRFLFIVFRKSEGGKDDKEATLEKVFFWTMPRKDLLIAADFWRDTRDKIKKGDFDHFIAASDNRICHVRPKAKDSNDLMDTPFGKKKKKGYWLNREYILNVVNQNIEQREKIKKTYIVSDREYSKRKDKSSLLPLFSIQAACGYFGSSMQPEIEGYVDVSDCGFRANAKTQFVVHAKGNSMLPKIQDGDLCVFEWATGIPNDGDVVLAEFNARDIEYGGAYTIKKFYGKWSSQQLQNVELRPTNSTDYRPIVIHPTIGNDYRIVGILKKVIVSS